MDAKQLLLGAALAALVAFLAARAHALTRGGAGAAFLVGTAIFGLGGWAWAAALLTFFGTSSALSRWRRSSKEALGFEKTGRRDAGQVWANGGIATACALWHGISPMLPHMHLFFLTALAAANADTWATEIGAALGGKPYAITTFKPVPPGTSGAVSLIGTVAALAGAAVLALFALPEGACSVFVILAAGLLGSLLDSLLGATIQAKWRLSSDSERWTEKPQGALPPSRGLRLINNDAVNFLCTLFSVGLAMLFTAGH